MPVVHIDTLELGSRKHRVLVRALTEAIESSLETSGVHIVINEISAKKASSGVTLVRISIFKRDLKKKRAMAQAVTTVFVERLKIPAENVHIVIHEMSRDQYAIGGKLMCDS